MPKILLLAGSARKDSLNKKLAAAAAKLVKDMNAEATEIDLKDYTMPLYDGDTEKNVGLPEGAKKLKQVFVEHDGFFISSPEYNSSFSPLLKNSLDWISRPHEENEPSLIAFKGKVAALGAVSPGGLGGIRGLVPLRMMLGNIGVFVIPTQTAISSGFQAFDDKGALKDEGQTNMLKATLSELVQSAAKLT
jgi:NAD(P)H-dependent FMN reductase